MIERPIIEAINRNKLVIMVEYVFKANFNDSMWLEEYTVELDGLDREKLTWLDPYNGRSDATNTLIALTFCSDERFVILQKRDGVITEIETKYPDECIICDDHNDSMLVAAHIKCR